jgi:autotransporter-associated beta strand protein
LVLDLRIPMKTPTRPSTDSFDSRLNRKILCLSFLTLGLVSLPQGLFAQAYIWNGLGADSNFSTSANWQGGVAPGVGSGVTLYFAGTTQPTPFNNYAAGSDFGSWFLTNGTPTNFVVTGSSIGLWGKIENDSTNFFGIGISNISARAAIQINPVNGNLTISNSSVGGSIFLDTNASLTVFGDNVDTNRVLTLNTILSQGNGIGGLGSLVVTQGATVILLGSNTYGPTAINFGAVQVGNGGTSGSLGMGIISISNNVSSSLIFDRSDSVTLTNQIFTLTGTNTSFYQNGSGTVTIGGASDNPSFVPVVNSGTLVLGKTSGSSVHAVGFVGTINNGGTVKLGGTGGDQVYSSGGFKVNSGGMFDMAGLSEGFDQLSGAGVVTNSVGAASVLTLGQANSSTTFSGSIMDGTLSGAKIELIKTGSGTLTLSGANTYSGGTIISNGAVNVSADNNLGNPSGLVNISGGTLHATSTFTLASTRFLTISNTGATFTVDPSAVLSVGCPITNIAAASAAAMNVGGGGDLIIKSNFYIANDNSLTVNNATFEVDPGSSGVFNAGKFILDNTSSTVTMNFRSGTGNFTASDFFVMADSSATAVSTLNVLGGTMNLNGPSSAMRLLLGNQGTANINVSAGSLVVGTYPPIELGGDTQYSGNNASGTLTISGTGSVTVNGSAVFELGRNTSGKTGAKGTINLWGGTLTTARPIANANGLSYVNFSGGTLKAGVSSTTFLQGLTAATVSTNGALFDTGTYAITVGQPLLHDNGLSGVDGGLTKQGGTGTLTLSATNTYTGGTYINAGTLNISTDGNLGGPAGNVSLGGGTLHATAIMGLGATRSVAITNASTIQVDSAMTLYLTNGFNNASAAGVAGLTVDGGGTLSFKGNVNVANDNPITVNSATLEVDTGSSGTFTTAGKLTLANASGSTAVMNLKSGTVNINGPDFFAMADGSTTAISTLNVLGGALNLNMGSGQRMLIGNQGSANVNVSNGSLVIGVNPQVELGGDTQYSANNASGTLTITGAGAVTVNGSGIFELGRDSSGKTGAKGTINLWGGSLTSSRSITGADGTSVFSLNGGTLVASAANSAFLQGLSAANVSTNGAVIDTGAFVVTIPQPLQHDANVNGADGGLTKLSAGDLILSGTNTYTGPTLITAGRLFLDGILGTNMVAVTNGASLLGTGTINGPVTIQSGATLQPGSSSATIGTLSLSNALTLAGNAILLLNRTNSSNASLVLSTSNITYGGTLTVTNLGPALMAGDTFTLFQAASYTGGFTNVVLPALTAPLLWNTNNLAVNGTIAVQKATTILTLTSSENPSGYQDILSFTAVAAVNATGNVTFQTNGVLFDLETLTSGVATSVTTASLPRGTNLITAIYSGDGNYFPSTNALNQIVTNHPPTTVPASYVLNAGVSTLRITISQLLTNATDVDGDTISLVGVGTSTNGVTLAESGVYLLYQNTNNVNDLFNYTVADGYGGTNIGLVNIIFSTNSVFGQTSSAISTTNGAPTISFAGIPGYSYSVASSTNLTDWNVVWTTNAPDNGVFQFTDPNAPQPTAYYRLQYNP